MNDKLKNYGIIYLPSNISYLRKKKKINQLDLANYLMCSNSAISSWEKGKRIPDIIDLSKMSKYFNVDLNKFMYSDLRFEDSNLTEEEKRENERKECLNNLKKLSKEQEKEILEVVDVLVKSKMTNLSDKEE